MEEARRHQKGVTIADAFGDSLMTFVGESIEPGSVVHTDGWLGYEPLERHVYRHQVSYLDGQPAVRRSCCPECTGWCRY